MAFLEVIFKIHVLTTNTCIFRDRIFQPGVLLIPALNKAALLVVVFLWEMFFKAGYLALLLALTALPREISRWSPPVVLRLTLSLCPLQVIVSS